MNGNKELSSFSILLINLFSSIHYLNFHLYSTSFILLINSILTSFHHKSLLPDLYLHYSNQDKNYYNPIIVDSQLSC
jgi:hypothetical protein